MILSFIQDLYGEQNSSNQVFFTEEEAAICIKDRAGDRIMFASLTNLALLFRQKPTTPEDFCRQWLIRG
jgi:hypothetical protein